MLNAHVFMIILLDKEVLQKGYWRYTIEESQISLFQSYIYQNIDEGRYIDL